MRSLLSLTLLLALSTFSAVGDSQVIYFSKSVKANKTLKAFITKKLKENCQAALEWSDTTVRKATYKFNEIDQGVVDAKINVNVDVRYLSNDNDGDTINMVINYSDYPHQSEYMLSMEELEFTGDACSKS